MRVRLKNDIAGPHGVFHAGAVVSDAQLPREQLAGLVARGYADPVGEPDVERAVTADAPETADIKYTRKGAWYELADGRKVRGKAALAAALEG